MKGMKGKFIKKLKTVKQIGYLKPDRILQVSALDNLVETFPLKKSTFVDNFPFKSHNKPPNSPKPKPKPQTNQEPDIIDITELMKDLEEEKEEENDEEFDSENHIDDKENISPILSNEPIGQLDKKERSLEKCSSETTSSCCTEVKLGDSDTKPMPLSELDISSFRRPDMDSGSLFDPNLLAAFEQAVTEHIKAWEEVAETRTKNQNHMYPFFSCEDEDNPLSDFEDETDPLVEFEEKCPPGGSDSVIFYTTSLRGIRKTFEDCQSIRFLLESFRVIYYERDVSIHSEFRDELWRIMGEKLLPPRLFIKGRHIGGAEQVLRLNEQGRLRALFRDMPIDFSEGPCNGCSGLRFGLCLHCDGSKKVFDPDQGGDNGGFWRKCSECNENGLIVCPFCS